MYRIGVLLRLSNKMSLFDVLMKHDMTFYAGVGNSVSQSLSSCSDNRWVIRFISHIGSNFGAEDSGFRLVGLGVWFSLRVREVPGSNPGRALHYLFQTRLSKASTKATTIKHTQVLQLLHSSCSWKTDDFRMPYMSYKVNCPGHLYTTLACSSASYCTYWFIGKRLAAAFIFTIANSSAGGSLV